MVDKSWISLSRSSPQYMAGLNQFLEFAFLRGSDVRGKIRCPCEKCKFDKWKTREEVFAHCMDKQFPRYYLNWAFHGEGELHDNAGDLEVGSSSHIGMQVESSDDEADGGEHANNPGNNTVMEAFGQHEAGDGGDVVVDGPVPDYLRLEVVRDFFELMTEGDKPLYPDCMGWRFFSGSDASLKLRDELSRALVEANGEDVNEGAAESFNELVNEIVSKGQDLRAFAFKTKAMLSQMEHKVQSARQQESVFWHLASHGVPKTLHCLSLKLAEEYAVNAMARSRLPPPEHVSRLVSQSLHHLLLITDNVLAASVVVSSVVENVANPEKLVFHIVTDKKTYTPMHAWFATNPIEPAVLEVRGLHQYDWSEEVNKSVKEMMQVNHQIEKQFYKKFKEKEIGQSGSGDQSKLLSALRPSSFSLMNHLRMFIPQLFPDLSKIVLLDDDVVVQHDISSLMELDLNGKVSGSVFKSWCGDGDTCCHDNKYTNYFNFSHRFISSYFNPDHCAWLYGLNVFDLQAWRRTNITQTYLQWSKLNLRSGLALWNPGVLPPALIAFEGHVHPIDSTWLVTDLGYRYQSEEISLERLQSAVVIHFNGPAKPWLEIGSPHFRSLWNRYINSSDKFIRRCRITW